MGLFTYYIIIAGERGGLVNDYGDDFHTVKNWLKCAKVITWGRRGGQKLKKIDYVICEQSL